MLLFMQVVADRRDEDVEEDVHEEDKRLWFEWQL